MQPVGGVAVEGAPIEGVANKGVAIERVTIEGAVIDGIAIEGAPAGGSAEPAGAALTLSSAASVFTCAAAGWPTSSTSNGMSASARCNAWT